MPNVGANEVCVCGHERADHIYYEGECRPGFVCLDHCKRFRLREDDNAETAGARAIREFAASSDDMLSFVDAYRAECVNHGYSPDAAEKMAVHIHGYIVQSLRQTLAIEAGMSTT